MLCGAANAQHFSSRSCLFFRSLQNKKNICTCSIWGITCIRVFGKHVGLGFLVLGSRPFQFEPVGSQFMVFIFLFNHFIALHFGDHHLRLLFKAHRYKQIRTKSKWKYVTIKCKMKIFDECGFILYVLSMWKTK